MDTRVGLIARGDDRGLGVQTWEVARHLHPDRVLLVDVGSFARGFVFHPERFPGATIVPWSGGNLDEQVVRGWLDGLDVVYTAETFYDPRVPVWAADAGVATVCHVNPEFDRWAHEPDLPAPTVRWSATPWRLDRQADGTRVVPMPCPTDRWQPDPPSPRAPLRVLHVAGKQAARDRNGTNVVLEAARWARTDWRVTVTTQQRNLRRGGPTPRGRVTVRRGGVGDYWRLYEGHDLLVMPRRYGGLCLPVIEAAGAGLGIVMTDVAPNREAFPLAAAIPTRPGGGTLRAPGGLIDVANPDARELAAILDRFAGDPQAVVDARDAARQWAVDHSWDVLAPLWRDELAAAAALR